MKTVFSNDMVAHVWAQRSQDQGRNSNRSFSFVDGVLYSYRLTIAAFVKGTRKRDVCLILDDHSTMTTKRHLSMARRAVSGVPVFRVPYVQSVGLDKAKHKKNLAFFVGEYLDLCGKLKRAQNLWSIDSQERLCSRLVESASYAVHYAEMFGLRAPKLNPEQDASKLWAYRVARTARTSTPAHQAKLERARDQREARKQAREDAKRRENYSRNLDAFVRSMLNDDVPICPSYLFPVGDDVRTYLDTAEHARNAEEARIAVEQFDNWQAGVGNRPVRLSNHVDWSNAQIIAWETARDADQIRERAEQVASWRNGVGSTLYGYPLTLLRLRGENVETSQGASFPIADAVRAIPHVQRVRASGQGITVSGAYNRLVLGHFRIDAIAADGSVKAGCHDVKWPEIESIIDQLRERNQLSEPVITTLVEYQPKTGASCSCRPGIERDNCPTCEGTGMCIDFRAIRARSGV